MAKYIVNSSFMVEPKQNGMWLDFVRTKFIPSLEESAKFSRITLSRVLSAESAGHYTYSLLLEMEELEGYHYFSKEAMVSYSEVADVMFGAQVCHFITVMKPL